VNAVRKILALHDTPTSDMAADMTPLSPVVNEPLFALR
jgi:hypothetical protein